MKVHVIHGIRTGPDSPVKGLLHYLNDFDVRYVDYGYELALETRVFNSMLVGTIFPYIEPGDFCIGHSNGCAITYELMQRGAPIKGAAFINGALEQTIIRSAPVDWIDVYFNAGDEITEAAKLGAEIGIVDQDWGQLGHAGYVGIDTEIVNINCANTQGMPVVSGHSDFFTKLPSWGPFLAQRLLSHLKD